MTVVSVLRLPIRTGHEEEFLRVFTELDIFTHPRRSGGLRSGRLLRPLDVEEPFLVIAEWEDPDAYEGWLENPVREQLRERLGPVVSCDVKAGTFYEEA